MEGCLMRPGELTCAEPHSGGLVFLAYMKIENIYLLWLWRGFATHLSHLAKIVQEVHQLWKRKGNLGAHKSHFSRETLLPIQMTLINTVIFLKPGQLFWLSALGIILEIMIIRSDH